MGLEVSKFNKSAVQLFPLQGTAAILQHARDNNFIHSTPEPSRQATDNKIQATLPNVVAELIVSYMHPDGRAARARELCKVFQIEAAGQARIARSIDKVDSLQVQQADIQRVIDEYCQDPVKHPLPINERVYTGAVSINLKARQVSLEMVRFLKTACPNMQALTFKSLDLSDTILEVVAECTSLKKLHFEYTGQCTPKGLLSLCTLVHLESFSTRQIKGVTVQIAEQFLKAFKSLKELNFPRNDDTREMIPNFISALGSCPTLEQLRFPFFEGSLALLEKQWPTLTQLRTIAVYDNERRMGIEELQRIGNFNNLRSLELLDRTISLEVVRAWRSLDTLQELRVSEFTQEAFGALGRFSDLSHLTFSIPQITEANEAAWVESIRKLGATATKMNVLEIQLLKNSNLITAFSSFQGLEELEISYSGKGPSCTPIRELLSSLKRLQKLDINCHHLEAEMNWLDQVPAGLQKLCLNLPSFDKETTVEGLKRLTDLRFLKLWIHRDFMPSSLHVDDVLHAVAPHLEQLKELELVMVRKSKMTDRGLPTLQQFKNLERVEFSFNGLHIENIRAAVQQHLRLAKVEEEVAGSSDSSEEDTVDPSKSALKGIRNAAGDYVVFDLVPDSSDSDDD